MKVLKSSRNGDIPFVRREMNSYLFRIVFSCGGTAVPPFFIHFYTFTLLHFFILHFANLPLPYFVDYRFIHGNITNVSSV